MQYYELLNGLRVLEISRYSSCSYAGRLLSLSGAHVTKILPDSLSFCSFYDELKTMISLKAFKKEINKYVSKSDIVIADCYFAHYVSDLYTGAGVFIEYPFDYLNEEKELQARYSWAYLTGESMGDSLFIGGSPAISLIGAHIASASLSGFINNERKPIIININNIMISALEGAYGHYIESHKLRQRVGNRHHSLSPMAILKSKDKRGILIGAPTTAHWQLLSDWAGIETEEAWLDDNMRLSQSEAIETRLSEWTKLFKADELFHMGQIFRLPFAKVQSIDEVKQCQQLHARDFFIREKEDIKSFRLPWLIKENEITLSSVYRKRPLNRLRILDLTTMWSGPYSTRIFADHGAEVIKIEAPYRPDGIRANKDNQAPFFKELNRHKLSITLDLNNPGERNYFLQLVEISDIVINNFSPRVMENLNLTESTLWNYNPSLIIIAMSAFGATGPYRDYVGYGPTLESMAGIAYLTKDQKDAPYLPGFSISDILAGIHSAYALLKAIYFIERKGNGIFFDISQYEVACQVVGRELIQGNERKQQTPVYEVNSFKETLRRYPVEPIFLSNNTKTIGYPWKSTRWNKSSGNVPRFGEHNEQIRKLITSGH
ncbi:CoA transferase [Pueribacillus sp. YX66]|uniref:CoA transferase n=1 Tax=Pueribacillus sp. YX66 TaxID=3229242 RepID=UPI00358D6795